MKRPTSWMILTILLVFITLSSMYLYSERSIAWDDVQSADSINRYLDQMTLEEKVGQLLMPAIREMDGEPVTEMSGDLKKLIQTFKPGGIILFRENVDSRQQLKQLNKSLQKESELPLLISIDQEGGLVTRLPYFPKLSGNMALAATRNSELARETGQVIGAELKQVGIHINFAPSVDVNNNPNNPVIGVRSFGDDPRLVSEMGAAFMNGLHDEGVMAVAKHFPGHGSVNMDSHYVLPVSEQSLDELKQTELVPFQSMIEQSVPGIMTAHITFPNIDSSEFTSRKDGLPIKVPATLSPKIMNELLRKEMGFEGLIFTDSMEMKAIADHFGPGEAAVQAVLAGVDVIVMPDHLKVAYDALIEAVEDERISEKRLDTSVRRILKAKMDWVDPDLKEKPPYQAVQLEKKIAKQSVTLLSDQEELLPLQEPFSGEITLVASDGRNLESMKNALWKYHKKFHIVKLEALKNKNGSLSKDQLKLIEDGDLTVLITDSSTIVGEGDTSWEETVLTEVVRKSKQSILVMVRNPYDYDRLLGVDAAIAQYSDYHPSFQATADLIFGKIKANGELPVKRLNEK
ncbi:beta-N-acetylhexosaminidase [Pseudalkalibacillus berkeleyi]|uniref:beta-N-acetylhexosaminidase n=1 Tax=Pseudalkalibacillus berkeleyi TaxID=1069813 RepID=A0ABS9H1L9_9BACL|nr:beta-N-acetylhexosaminidase [Pseudalkalibacillus berkeleyi]MCF6137733.1 beta-N-acetylhexosaminidase [Pseudalkalibacillus berkeleyi]